MQVNRNELAGLLGVSLNTITAWIREGLPVKTKGRRGVPWEFDLADCIEWVRDRDIAKATGDTEGSTLAEAELRETRAKAALREIELAEKRGQVVPVEDSIRVVADIAATVRQRLRGIGARLGPMVAGEENPLTIQQQVEAEVDDALAVLSEYEPGDLDSGELAA